MRYQLDVPILAHVRLAEYEYELTLHAPEVAAASRPGQFMQVLYGQNLRPFTRRPFSVYRVDRPKGTFSIVYLARGTFTQGMRSKRAGETLSVVGPLGNWFEPDPDPLCRHILVAGGVGAPPIYFLAKEIHEHAKATVINGARTTSLLVAAQELAELDVDLHFTTDDGSHGRKGLVVDPLIEILNELKGPAHVYTCGPTPMLRAVSAICVERKVPCQVSVETVMPCGVGVCMGCVVKIRDNSEQGFSYLRSCYDGPVFNADQIIWD